MLNAEQFKKYIEETVLHVGKRYSGHSVTHLLLMTSAAESDFGTWLYQVKGPACGFFQIEPHTEKLIWKWCLENDDTLLKALITYSSGDVFGGSDVVGCLRYQIVLARANYRSWPQALPKIQNPLIDNDVEALATYWKRYWNTYHGDGSVPGAVNKYNKYVRGQW